MINMTSFKPMVEPPYRETHLGEWHLSKMPYNKANIARGFTGGYWTPMSELPSRRAWTLIHGPNSKLTCDQVIEMRALRNTGLSYSKIAARFGIGPQTAHGICTRKQWRHL